MNKFNTILYPRRTLFHLLLLFGFILGGAGCSSLLNGKSSLQPITSGCDIKKVTTTDVHWFKDPKGAWRVVGVLQNNSSKAVSKIELGVETRTSSDKAADQGEDVSAYPLDLQPGQQAPFTAWIDRNIPGLDHFSVEVNDCVLAETEEHGTVDIRKGWVRLDDQGVAQVTAQLSNPGPKPILVNGLIAAVYDPAGRLIMDDYAVVTPRILAPGESGPVRASMDLPPATADKVNSFQLFMDVLVNQPASLPIQASKDVQLISHYTDKDGHFHLLGQLTNTSPKALMTTVQATVYTDASKTTVADTAELATWLPLAPGESLPFDLSDWGPLNATRGLWDQLAGQNAAIDVRLEPFLTWNIESGPVTLSTSEVKVSYADQQATFTGKVTNDSGRSIATGSVTAVFREKAGGQIVALGTTHLGITDSAAAGQVLDFSISIPLPANIDPAGLEFDLAARGYHP